MSCGIYKIINKTSNRFYIGSSRDIEKRFDRHLDDAKKGKHHSMFFQNVYDKYGRADFIFEIIELCEKSELLRKEQCYLDTHLNDNAMNVSRFASGGDLLTNHPYRADIVLKMTKSLKQRFSDLSKEDRQKIYGKPGEQNPMYGRTHTLEAKNIISAKHKNNQYALGSKRSEEHRKIISDRQKTRTGEKNSFFGKTHSPEVKEMLSKKQRGKLPPNSKKVSIEGIEYRSASEAGRALNLNTSVVTWRVHSKNEKFSNYFYLDKSLETIPMGVDQKLTLVEKQEASE